MLPLTLSIVLFDDGFVFFDLQLETFLSGSRVLLILQLFFSDREADFVSGDVGEDSHLAIAGNKQLSSEGVKCEANDWVVEDSFDFLVQNSSQSGEKFHITAGANRNDMSRVRKRN